MITKPTWFRTDLFEIRINSDVVCKIITSMHVYYLCSYSLWLFMRGSLWIMNRQTYSYSLIGYRKVLAHWRIISLDTPAQIIMSRIRSIAYLNLDNFQSCQEGFKKTYGNNSTDDVKIFGTVRGNYWRRNSGYQEHKLSHHTYINLGNLKRNWRIKNRYY